MDPQSILSSMLLQIEFQNVRTSGGINKSTGLMHAIKSSIKRHIVIRINVQKGQLNLTEQIGP